MPRLCLFRLLLTAGLVAAALARISPPLIAAQSPEEAFYDARFPNGCDGKAVPPKARTDMKALARTELNRANIAIESVSVLDIKCATGKEGKVLGAVVLTYGTPPDPDALYAEFTRDGDIRKLLNYEQYGVFQFDAGLVAIKKTVKVLPSQRRRDYIVKITLPAPDQVEVKAGGSYTFPEITERMKLLW